MQTIHVALDRDSFQEMNRFVFKAGRRKRRGWNIFLHILFVLFLIAILTNAIMLGDWLMSLAYVAGIALVVFFVRRSYKKQVDKAFEQATKIGSLEYDIDIYEDHFEVRARSGQTNLTYDQLYSLQADDKYFYLFLYATQLDIVPKTLCTDETRAILESHLRVG